MTNMVRDEKWSQESSHLGAEIFRENRYFNL
jgi:hypothetical protein